MLSLLQDGGMPDAEMGGGGSSIEIYGHGWKQNGRDGGQHGLVVLLEYMRRLGAEWKIRGDP